MTSGRGVRGSHRHVRRGGRIVGAAATAGPEGGVDACRGDETGRFVRKGAVTRAHGDESLRGRPQNIGGHSDFHFSAQPLDDVLNKVEGNDRAHVPLKFRQEEDFPFLWCAQKRPPFYYFFQMTAIFFDKARFQN